MNVGPSARGFLYEHAGALTLIARLLDAAAVVIAGWVAIWVRFGFTVWRPPEQYLFALLLGALFTLVVFPAGGIYRSWRGQRIRAQVGSLAISWTIVAALLASLATLTKTGAFFSRQWMLLWYATGAVSLVLFRVSLLVILRRQRKQGKNRRHVIIIGAGSLAHEIARRLRDTEWAGLEVSAFFAPDSGDPRTNSAVPPAIPILSLAELETYVDQQPVDEAWFALQAGSDYRVKDILHKLRHCTATIRYVPDVEDFRLLNPALNEVAGIAVLDLNVSPIRGFNRIVKATEDMVLGFLFLLLTSPLMLCIAVGVKLSSPGPVLFKQRRHGWNGKPIKIYKFRTMRQHIEVPGVVTQARLGDERITRFGALLRRSSLDELPQFVNVLQGRMSIVGPRPHALAHNQEYRDLIDEYMQRHKVKPGITGWAQINGWRGETDCMEKMKKRVELDLYYIRHWSLWFDLRIIALTPFRGLVHKNAY